MKKSKLKQAISDVIYEVRTGQLNPRFPTNSYENPGCLVELVGNRVGVDFNSKFKFYSQTLTQNRECTSPPVRRVFKANDQRKFLEACAHLEAITDDLLSYCEE